MPTAFAPRSAAAAVVAFAALAGWNSTASAQSGSCRAVELPTVEVRIQQSEPQLVRDRTSIELTRLQARRPAGPSGPLGRRRVLGLTDGQITTGIEVEHRTRSDSLNGACAWPSSVLVTLEYRATVYVARDIDPNSCRGQSVLRHEYEHVAIDRRQLQAAAENYRTAAANVLQSIGVEGPMRADQLPAWRARIGQRIQMLLRPAGTELSQRRNADHAALDTPLSYAQLAAECAPPGTYADPEEAAAARAEAAKRQPQPARR